MTLLADEYPALAAHLEGKPGLEYWVDERAGMEKVAPTGPDRQDRIEAFAYWAAHAADGNYKELRSIAGYIVWIAYVDIAGVELGMELYLGTPCTDEDYRAHHDGIRDAVARIRAQT